MHYFTQIAQINATQGKYIVLVVTLFFSDGLFLLGSVARVSTRVCVPQALASESAVSPSENPRPADAVKSLRATLHRIT